MTLSRPTGDLVSAVAAQTVVWASAPTDAAPALARALDGHARAVVALVEAGRDAPQDILAGYVAGRGVQAEGIAAGLRAAVVDHDTDPEWVWRSGVWLDYLARGTWLAEVGPRLDRARERQRPALFGAVVIERRGLAHPGAELVTTPAGLDLVTPAGATVAAFDLDTRSEIGRLREGLRRVRGSLVAERLFRCLPREVHRQALAGINPCNVLAFANLRALGDLAGIASGRDLDRIPEVLEILRSWRGARRDLPPLLEYWYTPRRALRVTVLDGLAYTSQTAAERLPAWTRRAERMLLPVLTLPDVSWASRDKHGRLAALQWELLFVMRTRIADYAAGFVFRDAEVLEATDYAGVDQDDARLALAKWSDGPTSWLNPKGRGLILADLDGHALFEEAAALGARRKAGK